MKSPVDRRGFFVFEGMYLRRPCGTCTPLLSQKPPHKAKKTIKMVSPTEDILTGFETMMVSITDVIAAMVSERPYRPSLPVYRSLEYVKLLIADQYPSEFRLLVSYFKQFYSTSK